MGAQIAALINLLKVDLRETEFFCGFIDNVKCFYVLSNEKVVKIESC